MYLLNEDELKAVGGCGNPVMDLIKSLKIITKQPTTWEQIGKNYEICLQNKGLAQPNGQPNMLDNMDCFYTYVAPHIPNLPTNH